MTRTGRGAYRTSKPKAKVGGWIKTRVRGGGFVEAAIRVAARSIKHDGPTLNDEHPQAGLFRYLKVGRDK